MHRRANKDVDFDEPACWGSGELSLVPFTLGPAVRGVKLVGVKNEISTVSLYLEDFLVPEWPKSTKNFTPIDETLTLLDVVLETLQSTIKSRRNLFDVSAGPPLINADPIGISRGRSFPFEVRTWDLIENVGISTDLNVVHHFSMTFLDLVEFYGDVRAALDVSVTGAAWMKLDDSGDYHIVKPQLPISWDEAGSMARQRAFRCRGLDPSRKTYSREFADVIPRNWSIGQDSKWTLDRCGTELGLTRERIRQVSRSALWDVTPRNWGQSLMMEEFVAILSPNEEYRCGPLMLELGVDQSDATALLIAFGYHRELISALPTNIDELENLGIRFSDIQRIAYISSERLGFVTKNELCQHISNAFPTLTGALFDEVIERLSILADLPYGFVYVEGSEGSYFTSWMRSLLSWSGRLPFDEAYGAAVRFCKSRIGKLVFPPRTVIKSFFELNPDFAFDGATVDLVLPDIEKRLLAKEEAWFEKTICDSTGHVIHSAVLSTQARKAGIRPGTLNIYSRYSLYFKPIGRGCFSLTGSFPSDLMIDLAVAKSATVRSPTIFTNWGIDAHKVTLDFVIGSTIVDTGVLFINVGIRNLIEGKKFKVIVDDVQHGHASMSGANLYGLVNGLNQANIVPGDSVQFQFDIAMDELQIIKQEDRDVK